MLRTFFITLVLWSTIALATTLPSSTQQKAFIGSWQSTLKMPMEGNVTVQIDMQINYDAQNHFASLAHIAILYDHNMSHYNSSSIEFKKNHLVVASYMLIGRGTWSVQKDIFIEKTESFKIIKNKYINDIRLKGMPIDAQFADLMVMMMKEEFEKSKKEPQRSKIVKITKDAIDLIGEDENKMRVTLKRMD